MDGLFDSDTSGGGYSPGLLPSVASAYQNDPRRALVQSLMQQGQAAQNTRLYNPLAALASALTQSAGGISGALLARQYQDANQGAQDTLRQGISALAGSTDPTTGKPIPGDIGRAAQILGGNQYTIGQAQDLATKSAILRAELANTLKTQNKDLNADGSVSATPGAPAALKILSSATSEGTASGTNAANAGLNGDTGQAAVIRANTPAEAAKAATVDAAENPALIARAGGSAGAASNATLFNDIIKARAPLVPDRATGETLDPLNDPNFLNHIRDAIKGSGFVGGSMMANKPQMATAPLAAPTQPQGAIAGAPPQVVAGAPGTAAPAPAPLAIGANSTVKPFNGGDPMKEVPSVPMPSGLIPKGPLTVIQGRDQVAATAGEHAVEGAQAQYKETQESAKAATQNMSALSTLRTQLQNGVDTNALAPAKAAVTSYIAALTSPETAAKLTGVDPAQVNVFQGAATRMGLTFARQTEGAHEAVAAIQIALTANPSLANTKEGNMKLIDLMEAGAKHDIDAQTYANAAFQKNGHYIGAKEYFDQAHPPAEYVSRVLPYNRPPSDDALQQGVTYKGANGLGVWNGSGFTPAQ